MARAKVKPNKSNTSVRVTREESSDSSFFSKIQNDLENKQSLVSLVLGALIVIVIGYLLINYFTKPEAGDLGPAQQESSVEEGDVAKSDLPGKYTVKEGDTLFTIAEGYFGDGYKYSELVKANSLADENSLEVGQVLEIPKLDQGFAEASPTADATPNEIAQVSPTPTTEPTSTPTITQGEGKGGAENITAWGDKIEGDTYTVAEGDWLSKVAGRAYGDIYQFEKIAKINNISNPDLIEPGMVLKIPR